MFKHHQGVSMPLERPFVYTIVCMLTLSYHHNYVYDFLFHFFFWLDDNKVKIEKMLTLYRIVMRMKVATFITP
jgi:hypothetical protein